MIDPKDVLLLDAHLWPSSTWPLQWWLRDVIVLLVAVAIAAAIATAIWMEGVREGYRRGAEGALEELGGATRTGSCAVEYAGYQKCVTLADGRIVLVRGFRP